MRKEDFLETALNKRREQHAFRQLRLPGRMIDFCSNDYLGLARSERVQEEALVISRQLAQVHGSGGSRLLAGNYELVEQAEQVLAKFHEAPAGLIYNSGYDANLGLFSAVPQKGDTIIYDQLIHASIRDGVRLSAATSQQLANRGEFRVQCCDVHGLHMLAVAVQRSRVVCSDHGGAW